MYRYCLILLFLFFVKISYAQVSHNDKPLMRGKKIDSRSVLIPKAINKGKNGAGKSFANSNLKVLEYADVMESEYDILESHSSDTIDNSIVVKRVAVSSKGAVSLSLFFNKYRLTEGAKLFIYNDSRVVGSFTQTDNVKPKTLSTEVIKGDSLVIELSYPLGTTEPILELSETYKGKIDIFKLKSSQSCNVNINCPEGADWQIEKRAICKMTKRNLLFSGVLINNTKYDGEPYVLTAMHAIRTETDAEQSICYFGYEAQNCDGTVINEGKTVSVAELMAVTDKLDFALVKLSQNVPIDYQPVFAGFNLNALSALNSTCIHHPNGDVKKISLNYDPLISATYTDALIPYIIKDSHWLVKNWEEGTTEGGSSGSPIFDENHLIVGTLSGGGEACSENIYDHFSKIDYAWDYYSDKSAQLSYWLNQEGTEILALGKYVPYEDTNIEPFAIPYPSEKGNGKICIYTDVYGDNKGLNCKWDFGEDAVPRTAEGLGPFKVTYSSSGMKSVSYEVIKNGVPENKEKEDLIYVNLDTDIEFEKNIACTSEDITMNALNIEEGTYDDYLYMYGKGANPVYHTMKNSKVSYEKEGVKDVYFNSYRSGRLESSIIKYSYTEVLSSPIAKFNYNISDKSVEFTNLSINADAYNWEFGDNDTSNEVSPLHKYDSGGKYSVTLTVSNEHCIYNDKIVREINLSYADNVEIYPNPAKDIVNIKFKNIKSKDRVRYMIFDSVGRRVNTGYFSIDTESEEFIVKYDVSNLTSGLYFLKLSIDNKMITRKLIVE